MTQSLSERGKFEYRQHGKIFSCYYSIRQDRICLYTPFGSPCGDLHDVESVEAGIRMLLPEVGGGELLRVDPLLLRSSIFDR